MVTRCHQYWNCSSLSSFLTVRGGKNHLAVIQISDNISGAQNSLWLYSELQVPKAGNICDHGECIFLHYWSTLWNLVACYFEFFLLVLLALLCITLLCPQVTSQSWQVLFPLVHFFILCSTAYLGMLFGLDLGCPLFSIESLGSGSP